MSDKFKILRYSYHSQTHKEPCKFCGNRGNYLVFDCLNDGYEKMYLCEPCYKKVENEKCETSYVPEFLDEKTGREIVPWIHTEHCLGITYVQHDTALGRNFWRT